MNESDQTETVARLVVDVLMGVGGMVAGAVAFWSSTRFYLLSDWVSWASWQTYLFLGYIVAGGIAGLGAAEVRRSRTLAGGTPSRSRSRRRTSASWSGRSSSSAVTRWLRQRGWQLGVAVAVGAFVGWEAVSQGGPTPYWPCWVAGTAIVFGLGYWGYSRMGYYR